MIYQLSSGINGINGPIECRYAVGGIFAALKKEFPDIEEVRWFPMDGDGRDSYQSVVFTAETDLSALAGTLQWSCKSPFRPGHKRKNWFVSFGIIPEIEESDYDAAVKDQIRVERFHCGGHGGQNVNKVESGIRIIHTPTGIAVTATRQRTQDANRKEALRRLQSILKELRDSEQARQKNRAWQQHNGLVRGNPTRVYRGPDFTLQEE